MRPAYPQSLDFELDKDFVPPNFFRSDVKVKNQRHLIFATDAAMSVLPQVKTVYMDGINANIFTGFTIILLIQHWHIFVGETSKMCRQNVCTPYRRPR